MKRKSKKKAKRINIFGYIVPIIILVLILCCATYLFQNHSDNKEKSEPTSNLVTHTYTPQFVLISFDGSKSVDMWRKIGNFKKEMNDSGKDISFTHFINAAYFLTDDTRYLYTGPGQINGTSNIGFSDDFESLNNRIQEINFAIGSGDEIASHTVGHFSGKNWSKESWEEEFGSFDKIIFNLPEIYKNKNLSELAFKKEDLVGFRAPFLDKSSGMYAALYEKKFLYDTSEIGMNNKVWPYKDAENLWHIPMGIIDMDNLKILAMDYNIWLHHSYGENSTLKKGTPEWDRAYQDTLDSFRNYFTENYTSTRAPVLIGYHFEEWNDGVYWEALKQFARTVCGIPEVECGTFKELVEYMEVYGVPQTSVTTKNF